MSGRNARLDKIEQALRSRLRPVVLWPGKPLAPEAARRLALGATRIVIRRVPAPTRIHNPAEA